MDALPSDPTAEACVLLAMLYGQHAFADVGDLITSSWRHQVAFDAIRLTHKRYPTASPGEFFLRWSYVLCERECQRTRKTVDGEPWHQPWTQNRCTALAIYESLEALRERAGAYRLVVRERACWLCRLHAQQHEVFAHTFEFWCARLRACQEARRLIELAHSVATRAWSLDLAGARGLLNTRGRPSIRIDLEGLA